MEPEPESCEEFLDDIIRLFKLDVKQSTFNGIEDCDKTTKMPLKKELLPVSVNVVDCRKFPWFHYRELSSGNKTTDFVVDDSNNVIIIDDDDDDIVVIDDNDDDTGSQEVSRVSQVSEPGVEKVEAINKINKHSSDLQTSDKTKDSLPMKPKIRPVNISQYNLTSNKPRPSNNLKSKDTVSKAKIDFKTLKGVVGLKVFDKIGLKKKTAQNSQLAGSKIRSNKIEKRSKDQKPIETQHCQLPGGKIWSNKIEERSKEQKPIENNNLMAHKVSKVLQSSKNELLTMLKKEDQKEKQIHDKISNSVSVCDKDNNNLEPKVPENPSLKFTITKKNKQLCIQAKQDNIPVSSGEKLKKREITEDNAEKTKKKRKKNKSIEKKESSKPTERKSDQDKNSAKHAENNKTVIPPPLRKETEVNRYERYLRNIVDLQNGPEPCRFTQETIIARSERGSPIQASISINFTDNTERNSPENMLQKNRVEYQPTSTDVRSTNSPCPVLPQLLQQQPFEGRHNLPKIVNSAPNIERRLFAKKPPSLCEFRLIANHSVENTKTTFSSIEEPKPDETRPENPKSVEKSVNKQRKGKEMSAHNFEIRNDLSMPILPTDLDKQTNHQKRQILYDDLPRPNKQQIFLQHSDNIESQTSQNLQTSNLYIPTSVRRNEIDVQNFEENNNLSMQILPISCDSACSKPIQKIKKDAKRAKKKNKPKLEKNEKKETKKNFKSSNISNSQLPAQHITIPTPNDIQIVHDELQRQLDIAARNPETLQENHDFIVKLMSLPIDNQNITSENVSLQKCDAESSQQQNGSNIRKEFEVKSVNNNNNTMKISEGNQIQRCNNSMAMAPKPISTEDGISINSHDNDQQRRCPTETFDAREMQDAQKRKILPPKKRKILPPTIVPNYYGQQRAACLPTPASNSSKNIPPQIPAHMPKNTISSESSLTNVSLYSSTNLQLPILSSNTAMSIPLRTPMSSSIMPESSNASRTISSNTSPAISLNTEMYMPSHTPMPSTMMPGLSNVPTAMPPNSIATSPNDTMPMPYRTPMPSIMNMMPRQSNLPTVLPSTSITMTSNAAMPIWTPIPSYMMPGESNAPTVINSNSTRPIPSRTPMPSYMMSGQSNAPTPINSNSTTPIPSCTPMPSYMMPSRSNAPTAINSNSTRPIPPRTPMPSYMMPEQSNAPTVGNSNSARPIPSRTPMPSYTKPGQLNTTTTIPPNTSIAMSSNAMMPPPMPRMPTNTNGSMPTNQHFVRPHYHYPRMLPRTYPRQAFRCTMYDKPPQYYPTSTQQYFNHSQPYKNQENLATSPCQTPVTSYLVPPPSQPPPQSDKCQSTNCKKKLSLSLKSPASTGSSKSPTLAESLRLSESPKLAQSPKLGEFPKSATSPKPQSNNGDIIGSNIVEGVIRKIRIAKQPQSAQESEEYTISTAKSPISPISLDSSESKPIENGSEMLAELSKSIVREAEAAKKVMKRPEMTYVRRESNVAYMQQTISKKEVQVDKKVVKRPEMTYVRKESTVAYMKQTIVTKEVQVAERAVKRPAPITSNVADTKRNKVSDDKDFELLRHKSKQRSPVAQAQTVMHRSPVQTGYSNPVLPKTSPQRQTNLESSPVQAGYSHPVLSIASPQRQMQKPPVQAGYSPPVMPIASYERKLELLSQTQNRPSLKEEIHSLKFPDPVPSTPIVVSAFFDTQTQKENLKTPQKETTRNRFDNSAQRNVCNAESDKSGKRKISLHEYKKRLMSQYDQKIKTEIKSECLTPEYDIRRSTESGYDSDSTVRF